MSRSRPDQRGGHKTARRRHRDCDACGTGETRAKFREGRATPEEIRASLRTLNRKYATWPAPLAYDLDVPTDPADWFDFTE